MIFDVRISDDIEIKSQEDHIDFEWFEIEKIEDINLLPEGIKKLVK